MAKVEANQVELMVKLRRGHGILSPSGKQIWTLDELAAKFDVSKTTVHSYMKKGDIVVDKTIDVDTIKNAEAAEATKLMSDIRSKMSKEIERSNLFELSKSHDVLSRFRHKKEELVQENVKVKGILEWLSKQSDRTRHDTIKIPSKKGSAPKKDSEEDTLDIQTILAPTKSTKSKKRESKHPIR